MISGLRDLLFFRLVMSVKVPFSSMPIMLDVHGSKLVLNSLTHSWLHVVVLPLGNRSEVVGCCSLLLLHRYL